MGAFDPKSPADIGRLVRDHPLATVISNGVTGFSATPLPLIAETARDGRITALIGHFARSNPHVAQLRRDPRALAVFCGPQAYVSPRLVSKAGWGPTWNYAMARFQVAVTLTPEDNDRALALLINALEGQGPGAWRATMMGERYDRLASGIVAFRAQVVEMHATFKLGQDEDDVSFAEIIARIDDRQVARMMVEQRRP